MIIPSQNFKKTIQISPFPSPSVCNQPKWKLVFYTPPNDFDNAMTNLVSELIFVDA